jgi:serine/threonine protein kinase
MNRSTQILPPPPDRQPDREGDQGADEPPDRQKTSVIGPPKEGAAAINDYRIVKRIGAGGMGTVYLARDQKLDRYVALKRLKPEFWSNPVMRERFSREARSIAALSHPNIVHVYLTAEDESGPFIAMEYVPGPEPSQHKDVPGAPLSLEDKVEKEGAMSVPDAVKIVLTLCRALETAHAANIIHRDLKPSNVLISLSSEPKVVDFGLAMQPTADSQALTAAGTKMISLGYSAPEQESDARSVDQRADIYSLGGILYFCLTGENPRFFREARVPDYLRPTILKAMDSDRTRRWDSVQEFEEALFQSEVISPEPVENVTWCCKWCHTINPLARRYCSDCGWDGMERCKECGAESRIGVQYCGSCGTDGRTYEEAVHQLNRLNEYEKNKKFHLIQEEGGGLSFQPMGDNGRGILDEIGAIRSRADRSLTRRTELEKQIPIEYKRENYDRLEHLLREYEKYDLSHTYVNMQAALPHKIAGRDVTHARVALREKDWVAAERICRNILENYDHDSDEANNVLRRIVRERRLAKLYALLTSIFFALLVYAISLGPIYRMAEKDGGNAEMLKRAEAVYAPMLWARENTLMRGPIEAYARLWGLRLFL